MSPTASPDARFEELQEVLHQHRHLLGKIPGLVSAQVGYRVRDGRLTDEPAILITVLRKRPLKAVPADERVSEIFSGLPVDVVQASIAEQLAYAERPPAQLTDAASLIAPLPWESELPAVPASLMEGNNYVPPTDIRLKEVDEKMTVLCHVSPDAGWPNLKAFIEFDRQATHTSNVRFECAACRAASRQSYQAYQWSTRLYC